MCYKIRCLTDNNTDNDQFNNYSTLKKIIPERL